MIKWIESSVNMNTSYIKNKTNWQKLQCPGPLVSNKAKNIYGEVGRVKGGVILRCHNTQVLNFKKKSKIKKLLVSKLLHAFNFLWNPVMLWSFPHWNWFDFSDIVFKSVLTTWFKQRSSKKRIAIHFVYRDYFGLICTFNPNILNVTKH